MQNLALSQLLLIKQHHSKHKRRLERIIESRPSNSYAFNHSFTQMLQAKRSNHIKRKQFQRHQEQGSISADNQKMFNKLISISSKSGPYSQSLMKSTGGFGKAHKFVEEHLTSSDKSIQEQQKTIKLRTLGSLHESNNRNLIKRLKKIDEENVKIGERILRKTSYLSHEKDMEGFRKTRQILHRLKKHDKNKTLKEFKQKNNSGKQYRLRSNTMPTGNWNSSKINASKKSEDFQKPLREEKFNQKTLPKRQKTIFSIKQQSQKASSQFNRIKNNSPTQLMTGQIHSKLVNQNQKQEKVMKDFEYDQEQSLLNRYLENGSI